MDATHVQALFGSDAGLREVQTQIEQAQAIGITAVPTVVFDGRWAISGAQETEVFLKGLTDAFAEGEAPESVADAPSSGVVKADGHAHHRTQPVLLHPETGNDLMDHKEYAVWLGEPQELDFSIF